MNITINLTITIGTAADGTQTVTIAPQAASVAPAVPTPPPVVEAPVAASESVAVTESPTRNLFDSLQSALAAPAGSLSADELLTMHEGALTPYTDEDDELDGEPVPVGDLFAIAPPAPAETPADDVSEETIMAALQAIQQGRRVPPGSGKAVPILEARAWIFRREGRWAATATGSVEANRWTKKNRHGAA